MIEAETHGTVQANELRNGDDLAFRRDLCRRSWLLGLRRAHRFAMVLEASRYTRWPSAFRGGIRP
jgi:hypothetical protein